MNKMGTPYFVQAPPAQTTDTFAYFIIGVKNGGWGSKTRVVCTASASHNITTYPTGGKDFAMQHDGPFPVGPAWAEFSFENEKTGEQLSVLRHEWEVAA